MVYAKDKRTLLLNEAEEKRKAQIAAIQFRRNVLEHQRQKTYQHEYERILNNIARFQNPGLGRHDPRKKRLNHLKKVAQQSLEGAQHPIHKPNNIFQ